MRRHWNFELLIVASPLLVGLLIGVILTACGGGPR